MIVQRPGTANSDVYASEGEEEYLRAAKNGNMELLLAKLKDGIDINAMSPGGLNALHFSAREGHYHIAEELIRQKINVHAQTKKKNTALHISALGGNVATVDLLLKNGADVNAQAEDGFTPVYMAAQENHADVVKLLVKHKADTHMAAQGGFEPLDVAIQQGHVEIVGFLLCINAKNGLQAVHMATKKDDRNALSLLLQNGHNASAAAPNGYTPMHIAAKFGSLNCAHLLVKSGAGINNLAKNRVSPLHVASRHGQTGLVTLLIEAGANLSLATKDGLTALHCSARNGHENSVELLLVHGCPVTAKTKHGLTALHMASQGNHTNCATHLLGHGAHLDSVTTEGVTPLHISAHYGHLPIVQVLLDKGADINKQAGNGYTALHVACKKNREAVVQLLLKFGALLHLKNKNGQTALHVSAFFGHVNLVLLLIQNGASVEATTVKQETIIHIACRSQQITIVRLLIRNGAKVTVASKDGDTPLHLACRQGSHEIVSLLLDSGADPDALNKENCSALHLAAKDGNEQILESLLDHNATVDLYSKRGFTPLHEACKGGHTNMVETLVKKGANIDAEGKNKLTPLHIACHYDHPEMASLLLENKANPHAVAKNGFTPLHVTAKKNQTETAAILLDKGVEPDRTTKNGVSSLHLAAKEGHVGIIDQLLEHGASPGIQTKTGLTPLHVAVRYNQIEAVKRLLKFAAPIDPHTQLSSRGLKLYPSQTANIFTSSNNNDRESGFTPLHLACYYGYEEIAQRLLEEGANVESKTKNGNTPLHLAAAKGHRGIINLLLKHNAPPNALNKVGFTALYIAEILQLIEVIETLTIVTQVKAKPKEGMEDLSPASMAQSFAAPEDLEETLLIDAADEAEDDEHDFKRNVQSDFEESFGFAFEEPIVQATPETSFQSAPPMFPVEHEERPPTPIEDEEIPLSEVEPSNAEVSIEPLPTGGFLVNFVVDARGASLQSSQTGVRITIPRGACRMPTRVKLRLSRHQRPACLPQLRESEAVVGRILEISPAGCQFLKPVTLEVPHSGSKRGRERELVVLRSDHATGKHWREHVAARSVSEVNEQDNSEEAANESSDSQSVTIVTQDFPSKFVIVSRPRKERFLIFPEGGTIQSCVVPGTQIVFPDATLNVSTKVVLQMTPFRGFLLDKGKSLRASAVLKLEPEMRLPKPISITLPCHWLLSNSDQPSSSSLRLLSCPLNSGGSEPGVTRWNDITDTTALTVIGNNVTFSVNELTRYWVVEPLSADPAADSTELLSRYTRSCAVPFLSRVCVFARRVGESRAEVRVLLLGAGRPEHSLEAKIGLAMVSYARDIEFYAGQSIRFNCSGNLRLVDSHDASLVFKPFRVNRITFEVETSDASSPMLGRLSLIASSIPNNEGKLPLSCCLDVDLREEKMTERRILPAVKSRSPSDDVLRAIASQTNDCWMMLAERLGLTDDEVQAVQDMSGGSDIVAAQRSLEHWRTHLAESDEGEAVLKEALVDLGWKEIADTAFSIDQSNTARDKEKLPSHLTNGYTPVSQDDKNAVGNHVNKVNSPPQSTSPGVVKTTMATSIDEMVASLQESDANGNRMIPTVERHSKESRDVDGSESETNIDDEELEALADALLQQESRRDSYDTAV